MSLQTNHSSRKILMMFSAALFLLSFPFFSEVTDADELLPIYLDAKTKTNIKAALSKISYVTPPGIKVPINNRRDGLVQIHPPRSNFRNDYAVENTRHAIALNELRKKVRFLSMDLDQMADVSDALNKVLTDLSRHKVPSEIRNELRKIQPKFIYPNHHVSLTELRRAFSKESRKVICISELITSEAEPRTVTKKKTGTTEYSGRKLSNDELVALANSIRLRSFTELNFRKNLLTAESYIVEGDFTNAIRNLESARRTSAPTGYRELVNLRIAFVLIQKNDVLFANQRKPNAAKLIRGYQSAQKLLARVDHSSSQSKVEYLRAYAELQIQKLQNGDNFLGLNDKLVPLESIGQLSRLSDGSIQAALQLVNQWRQFRGQARAAEQIEVEEKFKLELKQLELKRSDLMIDTAESELKIVERQIQAAHDSWQSSKLAAGWEIAKMIGMTVAGLAAGTPQKGTAPSAFQQVGKHGRDQLFSGQIDPIGFGLQIRRQAIRHRNEMRMLEEKKKVSQKQLEIAKLQKTVSQLSNRHLIHLSSLRKLNGGTSQYYYDLTEHFRTLAKTNVRMAIYDLYRLERGIAFRYLKEDLQIVPLDLSAPFESTKKLTQKEFLGAIDLNKFRHQLNREQGFDLKSHGKRLSSRVDIRMSEGFSQQLVELQKSGTSNFRLSTDQIQSEIDGGYGIRISAVSVKLLGKATATSGIPILQPQSTYGKLTHQGACSELRLQPQAMNEDSEISETDFVNRSMVVYPETIHLSRDTENLVDPAIRPANEPSQSALFESHSPAALWTININKKNLHPQNIGDVVISFRVTYFYSESLAKSKPSEIEVE